MVPVLSLLVFLTSFGRQSPMLASLEDSAAKATKSQPYDSIALLVINQTVIKMAANNAFTNPDELYRASKLISDMRNDFDFSRVKHELCLAALAGGDDRAALEIKKTWDSLIISTGREQRIGTMVYPQSDKFKLSPAPKSIRTLKMDPVNGRILAKAAQSDNEVTDICAADQAARENFSKMTAAQMNEMGKQDKMRLNRMLELLEAGRVQTAEDFDHASLVFQHGETWTHYCIAHELSICTLLLDSNNSAWLAAASYDRMLCSGGYHQRFATQYGSTGNSKVTLNPVDTTGIGDAERKAMKCPTLEEAKNRKWD
jgi:hypothetical protein